MKNKSRVVQISLDIVIGSGCDANEVIDDVRDKLDQCGFTIIGASFQEDMTEFYEKHYSDLFPTK